jgi:hypothetical protein
MILTVLLNQHPGAEKLNIFLTAIILYVIIYTVFPEYSLTLILSLMLADLLFYSRPWGHATGRKGILKKRVRFNLPEQGSTLKSSSDRKPRQRPVPVAPTSMPAMPVYVPATYNFGYGEYPLTPTAMYMQMPMVPGLTSASPKRGKRSRKSRRSRRKRTPSETESEPSEDKASHLVESIVDA